MRMLPRSQNASLLLIALLSVIPAVLWGLYAGFWYMDGLVLPGFLLGLGVWAANRFGARGDSGWWSIVFITVIMLVLWLYMRMLIGVVR